jgi:biotin carboxylase
MRFVVFVAPYFIEQAVRFIAALLDVPTVRLAVISQDAEDNLPASLLVRLVKHIRVRDVLRADDLVEAVQWLGENVAPVSRLVSVSEYVQLSTAEARDRLGLGGTSAEVTRNFRDKPLMKDRGRGAGLPCARFRLAESADEAVAFTREVGFPVVVKPPEGVGSVGTFSANNEAELADALVASVPSKASPVLLEEFVTGDEYTFDAIVINGAPVWHSLTQYLPNPIVAVKNPWIQLCVLLPREIDSARFDVIRSLGFRALEALGLRTGICHLEWFRRQDGAVTLSEVAARPGGAQIMLLNARAHDFDMYGEVARLLAYDTFSPPKERKYAAGVAFLRGQNPGMIRALHGVDKVLAEVGHLITDVKWPVVGQPRSASSYEGEGYVVVRHPETSVVEAALHHIVSNVAVEAG